jgi:hypothetical protein
MAGAGLRGPITFMEMLDDAQQILGAQSEETRRDGTSRSWRAELGPTISLTCSDKLSQQANIGPAESFSIASHSFRSIA